jgi:hypothetical protein
MIRATGNHPYIVQVFHLYWRGSSVNFALYFGRPFLYMVKEVQGGERLLDLEDEDMPFLSKNEQTLTGEGCLFDLGVSREEGV